MTLKILCSLQGLYFLLTGLWPLLHINSFIKVTGPKVDLWLVKTVGLLISIIGFVFIISVLRNEVNLEIFLLALGSSLSLTGIDIFYTKKRIISPIYLLDSAVEIFFIISWLILFFKR